MEVCANDIFFDTNLYIDGNNDRALFFDIKKDIERYGSINGYANDILRTTCESFKRNVKFTNKVHDGLNVNNGKTFFTYNVSPHISLYYKINYEIYTGEDNEINKIKRTISFEDYDVLKIVTTAINNEPNFDGFYEKLFELFDRADDYIELSKYMKKRYTLESLYSLAKKHMSDIYSHINEKNIDEKSVQTSYDKYKEEIRAIAFKIYKINPCEIRVSPVLEDNAPIKLKNREYDTIRALSKKIFKK